MMRSGCVCVLVLLFARGAAASGVPLKRVLMQ